MSVTGQAYTRIEVGAEASLSLLASAKVVEDYARLVGDLNPVHLDDEYAASSFFKKRVAHGMLAAGLVSAVLGTCLPGPGAIYLNQNLDFKRPVYIGDAITAWVRVLEKDDRHGKIKLRTWVENQAGQTVMDGSALILLR
jgi:3-hydroxybutyryl-CoA dehydratase